MELFLLWELQHERYIVNDLRVFHKYDIGSSAPTRPSSTTRTRVGAGGSSSAESPFSEVSKAETNGMAILEDKKGGQFPPSLLEIQTD